MTTAGLTADRRNPRRIPHSQGMLRVNLDKTVTTATSAKGGTTARRRTSQLIRFRAEGSRPKPAGSRMFTRATCLHERNYVSLRLFQGTHRRTEANFR